MERFNRESRKEGEREKGIGNTMEKRKREKYRSFPRFRTSATRSSEQLRLK